MFYDKCAEKRYLLAKMFCIANKPHLRYRKYRVVSMGSEFLCSLTGEPRAPFSMRS